MNEYEIVFDLPMASSAHLRIRSTDVLEVQDEANVQLPRIEQNVFIIIMKAKGLRCTSHDQLPPHNDTFT